MRVTVHLLYLSALCLEIFRLTRRWSLDISVPKKARFGTKVRGYWCQAARGMHLWQCCCRLAHLIRLPAQASAHMQQTLLLHASSSDDLSGLQLKQVRPSKLSNKHLSKKNKTVHRVYGGCLDHKVVRER